jgi:ubiquinone/menaquinone biosynthesis C-methylase UbiE
LDSRFSSSGLTISRSGRVWVAEGPGAETSTHAEDVGNELINCSVALECSEGYGLTRSVVCSLGVASMAIQPHNQKAAATWGSGGAGYDQVSETIADSIEHVLNRLNVQPGEKVLDLATGTGWTARRLAQKGASVTGVDIGDGVIAAAREFAKSANLNVEFIVGDAEKVDLPDAAFDVITSTCGVMFASRPEKVAKELTRLCRPGGRIGLTTWPPTSAIAQMFQMMKPYMPPPLPPHHRRRLNGVVRIVSKNCSVVTLR